MQVGVLTGSSNSGSSCIEELINSGTTVSIRAGFRTQEKSDHVLANHADAVNGGKLKSVVGVDASDVSSMLPVFEGCQMALVVTPMDHSAGIDQDAQKTINMIDAAVKAGVKHVIVVGSWTIHEPERLSILAARFVTPEKHLEALAADNKVIYTMLRGGFFMTNFLLLKEKIVNEGKFPAPSYTLPPVFPRDIGRVAACIIAAEGKTHENKAYEMSGPAMMTASEIAAAIGRGIGKTVEHVSIPGDAGPPFVVQLNKYLLEAGKNAVPFGNDIVEIAGKATTLEEFASTMFTK